ncbi:Spc7-domain-containing protein [Polychaeton citri CBS 116435]|uniref:Spc7-domain-containing protein n=1 Tax=Polychaeton citri CBS 116435 TaxID=1314669 RepID=A0A9P4Q2Y6_9PEZI|nr:Spc7-domain-containing protein [Polychaeton citri CBS 116435]
MSSPENKENFAPAALGDGWTQVHDVSPRKNSKKGRSKSIGPGGLDGIKSGAASANSDAKDAKNRRKSAFIPVVKSILPNKDDEAKRKAERRKSLANRRVSFAPEATLHTWDVIEYMRDHTTSTEGSENTRRESGIRHSLPGQTHSTHRSDEEPPSTPPEQSDDVDLPSSSPAHQRDLHQKKHRRSSGTPPMNFNNPEDASSPSGYGESSEIDGESESEGEDMSEEYATGTAMSLDVGDETQHSSGSASSTSSSARLEAALKQAADLAGTRGIAYDEFGEMSMELVSEEITNAFKPWAQSKAHESPVSPTQGLETFSTFSPAQQTKLVSGTVQHPATVEEEEEDEDDMSMDVTKAVGGILNGGHRQGLDSDDGDGTMDFTQAVGQVLRGHDHRQKRRRSTSESGSPGVKESAPSKRRRSSAARVSLSGDATMDFTVAGGGILEAGSPRRTTRRQSAVRSAVRRQPSLPASDAGDATMDFTVAAGRIEPAGRVSDQSFDEGFSMEMTTALGGIKEAVSVETGAGFETPDMPISPSLNAINTTPKEQGRFKDADDIGPPSKLLTPILQLHSSRSSVHQSEDRVHGSPTRTLGFSPNAHVTYPELPPIEDDSGQPTSVNGDAQCDKQRVTPERESVSHLGLQSQDRELSPSVLKQQRSSPVEAATTQKIDSIALAPQGRNHYADVGEQPTTPQQQRTPQQRPSPSKDGISLADTIKLMNTPRKETLRNVTPKKQTPAKDATPRRGMTPRGKTPGKNTMSLGSPARRLNDELEQLKAARLPNKKIHLQEFLDEAGVRFMDLTTTKRRMTAAPTPSKGRNGAGILEDAQDISLGSGVVAGACTVPELEMFSHACRELKRYLSEGKADIKQLEQDTFDATPPLITAYMASESEQREAIDTQLRDIKANARYRSKEMWYGWRSQLLEDLMKGLQGIGENLIKDDETLQQAEQVLKQALPPLEQQHENVVAEAEELEQSVAATSEEEKAELDGLRNNLSNANLEVEEKRKILNALHAQVHEQEQLVGHLLEVKSECTDAIKEADRVREACRGVSMKEVSELKASVDALETKHGWKVTSASSSPPTVTMTYRETLQLFFHPSAFHINGESEPSERPNTTISLFHNTNSKHNHLQNQTTTLRFFLQLLRASLLALPQYSTRLPDMLSFVSSGWDTALEVAEAERRLSLEGMADARIVSDEHLSISSLILLPKVKTKVKVAFDLVANTGESKDLSTSVQSTASVVYGEAYDGKKLTDFVIERIDGFQHWDDAIRELREKLVAQGPKKKRV